MNRGTYSPEDNKLRLYPAARLDAEEFARVKSAGFSWAPVQKLFVAPMWTPERADLLIEMCGEIDDEDQTLCERASERADRFETYSEKRADDADRARAAVSAIADNIPFGQPILVGHHSEKRARRDAEKIDSGMRKAIRMWDCAEYWTRRAAGAIGAAKYKERPDVRARRIKGIEADKRKIERNIESNRSTREQWRSVLRWLHQSDTPDTAKKLADAYAANSWAKACEKYRKGELSVEDCACEMIVSCDAAEEYPARWIQHYENRLAYERAMMAESGGMASDREKPEAGGGCKCWASPGHGRMFAFIQKVNRVSVTILDQWNPGQTPFTRTIPFDKLSALVSRAEVEKARAENRIIETEHKIGFVIHDTAPIPRTPAPAPESKPDGTKAAIQAIKESVRAGVQVVTAPQLFPTPAELAARIVAMADIQPGNLILEPSAGTGRIIVAIRKAHPDAEIVAVEIKEHLADVLRTAYRVPTFSRDFLATNGELGTFDRVIMNPPFERGSDIRHVEHAIKTLNPGGRLVAIVAGGPRQREAFEGRGQWIDLPPGSFASEGTNVNAAIIVIDKAPEIVKVSAPITETRTQSELF